MKSGQWEGRGGMERSRGRKGVERGRGKSGVKRGRGRKKWTVGGAEDGMSER